MSFLEELQNIGQANQPTAQFSPNSAPQQADQSFWDSISGFGDSDFGNMLLGGKDNAGLLGLGMDLFTGLKQFGLMEDQLDLGRDTLDQQKAFADTNLFNQAEGIKSERADVLASRGAYNRQTPEEIAQTQASDALLSNLKSYT